MQQNLNKFNVCKLKKLNFSWFSDINDDCIQFLLEKLGKSVSLGIIEAL
jgi:hypothetical protein